MRAKPKKSYSPSRHCKSCTLVLLEGAPPVGPCGGVVAGTNTQIVTLSLGMSAVCPTQTGLCKFGWVWSSLIGRFLVILYDSQQNRYSLHMNQARKGHININSLVRLPLGRPETNWVCPWDKPTSSQGQTQVFSLFYTGEGQFVPGTNWVCPWENLEDEGRQKKFMC